MKNISFITMSQGNPVALKRTLDSFCPSICNEIIFGDLCIFQEDRDIIESYRLAHNLKIVRLPFNYIFEFGFSSCLNLLAGQATNDLCLYNNVGEMPDGPEVALQLINEMFPDCNCYAINHGFEKHTWWRGWNRKELSWGGLIHEELTGLRRECSHYIFQFKDTDKDNDNPFKAQVYNSIKEAVYMEQYIKLVEHPELIGITNDWWVNFAKENYESNKSRMIAKGELVEALREGNLPKLLNHIQTSTAFKEERLKSSKLIEFQGDQKSL